MLLQLNCCFEILSQRNPFSHLVSFICPSCKPQHQLLHKISQKPSKNNSMNHKENHKTLFGSMSLITTLRISSNDTELKIQTSYCVTEDLMTGL